MSENANIDLLNLTPEERKQVERTRKQMTEPMSDDRTWTSEEVNAAAWTFYQMGIEHASGTGPIWTDRQSPAFAHYLAAYLFAMERARLLI